MSGGVTCMHLFTPMTHDPFSWLLKIRPIFVLIVLLAHDISSHYRILAGYVNRVLFANKFFFLIILLLSYSHIVVYKYSYIAVLR